MAEDSVVPIHQPERQRFVIVDNAVEAFLEYRMVSPQVIDFVHTYTPAEMRGRGLAAKLVEAGVAYAHAHELRVIGSCSYVAAWLQRQR
jgi:uncharacterized protein